MPQDSVGYAVGRISVRNRGRMDTARLDRLLAAQQPQEALGILQELGWDGGDKDAAGDFDFEQLAAEHVRRTCAFVREVSPDVNMTDCFLLRYDIHNLKMLLKARCLEQEAEFLSPCGIFGIEPLRHAVAEGRYGFLPPELARVLGELEKVLAVRMDPLRIDVALDQAMFRLIGKLLVRVKSKAARRYFAARADLTNAMILLRVRAMGRPESFLAQFLVPGGGVGLRRWKDAFAREELLPRLLAGYGKRVTEAARDALKRADALPNLERVMDNHLLSIFLPYRLRGDAAEVVAGYLLAQEREAAAVRLVMAGKLNGFSAGMIRERLRELYD